MFYKSVLSYCEVSVSLIGADVIQDMFGNINQNNSHVNLFKFD